jgi:hypothetical protein
MSDSTSSSWFIVIVTALTITCAGSSVVLIHWLSRKLASGTARTLAMLANVFVLLWAAPNMFSAIESTLDRGDCVCLTCGHAVRRWSLLGIAITTGPPEIDRGLVDSDERYRRLFDSKCGEDTSHDWMEVGCHSEGVSTVACTCIAQASWFAVLPELSDRTFARSLARKLVMTSLEERHALLVQFDMAVFNLVRELGRSEKPLETLRALDASRIESAFEQWYSEWSATHSDWPSHRR